MLVREMSIVADTELLDMQKSIENMTMNVVGQIAFG